MLQSGHGRRDGRTDGRWTDRRRDGVKPIYPPTTSLFGGIMSYWFYHQRYMYCIKSKVNMASFITQINIWYFISCLAKQKCLIHSVIIIEQNQQSVTKGRRYFSSWDFCVHVYTCVNVCFHSDSLPVHFHPYNRNLYSNNPGHCFRL